MRSVVSSSAVNDDLLAAGERGHRFGVRIASLVPSATDLVCSLGMADALVGVSHECDHPAAAGRPVVTRSAVGAAPTVAPAEVDRQVTVAVAAGESLYIADRSLLHDLRPDIVMGQAICDVCAVSPDVAAAALPPGAVLLSLTATSIGGLNEDLSRLGDALGRAASAKQVVADINSALGKLPRVSGTTVVTLEWSAPPFLGGHWVPELVEWLGARHLLSRPGQASRRTSWSDIRAAAPEVVVFMPCGYDLEQSAAEANATSQLLALDAAVWATDATHLYSRCTPDAIRRGAATLAGILTGEAVVAGARRIRVPSA